MLDYREVVAKLQELEYHDEAVWLTAQGIQAYSKILLGDFDRWLAANPDAFTRESLAARTARETGLELIAEE